MSLSHPFYAVAFPRYLDTFPPQTPQMLARADMIGGDDADKLARHSLIDDVHDAQRADAHIPDNPFILIY